MLKTIKSCYNTQYLQCRKKFVVNGTQYVFKKYNNKIAIFFINIKLMTINILNISISKKLDTFSNI